MSALPLLLLLASAPPASTGTALVLPPERSSAPPEVAWVGEAVADLLPRALALADVAAVEAADRLRAQGALQIPVVPLTRATSIRIAEALGATRLVTGTYGLDAQGLHLSLRLLDMERGTLSAPFVASGPLRTLSDLVHALAWDIALASPTPPPMGHQQFMSRRISTPFEALEAYGRGLLAREAPAKIKLIRHAMTVAPRYHDARLALGRLQLETGEASAAYETLGAIPADALEARAARFLQGVALLALGRYREATEVYALMAHADPSPAVLNNHALATLRAGAGDVRASQILRKAVEMDPASADSSFNLGWALLVEGDPAGAAPHLREVIRQDPLDSHARLLLAWALGRAGKTEEAAEEWKGVVAMAPGYEGFTNPDLTRRFERVMPSERPLTLARGTRTIAEVAAGLMGRAERLAASGDGEGALRELLRAAYLDPRAPRVHLLLARAYRARGDRERAVGELRMSLSSAEDAGVRAELALLLKEMGRVGEARVEAEKVLKLDPGNETARKILEAASGT